MRHMFRVLIGFGLALTLAVPPAVSAQEASDFSSNTASFTGAAIDPSVAGKTGPLKVVVELIDAPTTVAFVEQQARGVTIQAATTAAQRRLAQIDRVQQQLLPQLASLDATVLYRTQRVYNGFGLVVDASKVSDLARLPGVKAIHPLVTKYLDNSSSVPLIGAPALWDAGGLGLSGTNIKVGIIDTGIDYIHTDFAGSGLATDYARNNTAVITEAGLFPNARVVGGYDFVGDIYDAGSTTPAKRVPAPDADPMDCNGHGSHVAGTAGGSGVTSAGATYTGTYGPSTDFSAFRIGPGVAPTASLYALRVFGCSGNTDVTDLAIEWAIDPNGDGNFSDHLDVINMSLGSSFGSIYDSTAVASNNASAAGVIVVASAGNSGDTNFITGSPGSAESVISVASTVDAQDVTDAFLVNSPASIDGVYPGSRSANYNWLSPPAANPVPLTADLYYPATNQTGCQAWTGADLANIAGKIVLVDWRQGNDTTLPCGSVARANNAAAAGARGIVMADNTIYLEASIAGNAAIPGLYTVSTVGNTLKSALTAGQLSNVSVTLSAEYINQGKIVAPERVDTLSSFSSRGPARGNVLKPDIAAPGQSIFSAAVRTGSQGVTYGGTSMAAPHVAGAMALLKQLHPTWTVQELKALVMNTAVNNVRSAVDPSSAIYGPSRAGSGRINLPNAAAQQVLAYDKANPNRVSLTFGSFEVTSTLTLSKQITVVNKGTAAGTYNLSYLPTSEIPGVTYTLSANSVTVPAGGSVDLTVTMTANPAQMKHTADPTLAKTQLNLPRHWLSEAQGYLNMVPDGQANTVLRLPIYASARPASTMAATASKLATSNLTAPTTSTTISLTGTPVNTGNNVPLDVKSVVTAFELQHTSPQILSSAIISSSADLQYVGVTSNITSTGVTTATTLFFGISTYGDWSLPSAYDTEFDIYIDANDNGTADYVVVNLPVLNGTDPTDVFVSQMVNLQTRAVTRLGYINVVPASVLDTAIFNSNVMVLPVPAAALGLTSSASRISYQVATSAREADGIVDLSPVLRYNVAAPGISFSGGISGLPAYLDSPETTIPVVYNRANAIGNGTQGVLLLHHHNTRGNRAEVISTPSYQLLPLIGR